MTRNFITAYLEAPSPPSFAPLAPQTFIRAGALPSHSPRSASNGTALEALTGYQARQILIAFWLFIATSCAALAEQCAGGNHVYLAQDAYGSVTYQELDAGGSLSEAQFERRDASGVRIWHAEAIRACSLGVSFCSMSFDYTLDGTPHGTISAEYNSFTIDGTSYLLFSHLPEKIQQLRLKDYPRQDISFGKTFTEEVPAEAWVIPKLFRRVCAGV